MSALKGLQISPTGQATSTFDDLARSRPWHIRTQSHIRDHRTVRHLRWLTSISSGVWVDDRFPAGVAPAPPPGEFASGSR
jgi:hypothetical protein